MFSKASKLLRSFNRYTRSRSVVLAVLAISFLFQLNIVFMNKAYTLALGMEVALVQLLVIIPLIYLEGQNEAVAENPPIVGDGVNSVYPGRSSEFGLGNITYQAFLSPAEPGKVIWGAGPVFGLPTATDKVLGPDVWSAGGGFVVLAMPGQWVLGALAYNVWSVFEDGDDPDINKMVAQYFINYNFEGGWYATSTPIITADWEADSDQRWTVPFGGGLGRLTRFGQQPVDFKGQVFYNVEAPEFVGDWSFQFQVKFLFPKGP